MKNERFFGLHFDFHAKKDSPVGKTTNAEDIKKYIDEVKPDYIQCDCKGHPGVACYPTRVGTASEIMAADNLKIWVDTAHECGKPVYVHYSGVVDGEYAKAHPEHTFNYAKDDKDPRTNVFDEHYVKDLLIPQLKELITDYKIDGVWVDGDCWCLGTEFTDSGYITESMKPYLREDMTEKEVDEALREAFKVYFKAYVDELHAFKPDFKIISNWAYSSYMPEKAEIDVDFLSGDYYAAQASTGIRYEGRCMAAQDKLWDIMTWGFFNEPVLCDKSAVQLCQEAASTLMLGGGFEVYIMQNNDGSAPVADLTRLKNLSEFVKKRRFNYGKEMISQVGIFYSAETRYQKGMCYNQRTSTQCLQGTLHALLDVQYTVDMILEYQLDLISKYDVVVVPEWELMSDEVKEKLKAYAKGGGKLLIIGTELTKQMQNTDVSEDARYITDKTGAFINVGKTAAIKDGVRPIYKNRDLRDETDEAAYKTEKIDKGTITYIPFDLGSLYAKGSYYILRNFLFEVMETLTGKKIEINRKNVDMTLIDDGDGVILNLLNQNKNIYGMGEIMVYDEVPPVYELEVTVKGNYKKAESLTGDNLSFEVTDDAIKINLYKLAIHSAIKLI